MSLQSKAIQVNVGVQMPSFDRKNRGATAELLESKKAASNAGSFYQKLFDSEYTKPMTRMRGYIYDNILYQMTHPWCSPWRLLDAGMFLPFRDKMIEATRTFDQMADKFCYEMMADMVRSAKISSGELFDPTLYPDPNEYRTRFKVTVEYAKLPDSNFVIGLEKQIEQELSKQAAEKERERTQELKLQPFLRLQEILSGYITRFNSKQDQRFDRSAMEKVDFAISLLPAMNTFNDPAVDALIEEIRRNIAPFRAEDIRCDEEVKQVALDAAAETKRKVDEAMRRMQGVF